MKQITAKFPNKPTRRTFRRSLHTILHAGFVANDNVKYYFSASDLLTLTYRSATQSGVTQVAFHFEKLVLVTNVGGLAEIIPQGKCGYVVQPNTKEIADSLCDFYENKREEQLSEGMREEKKKYDWKIFVDGVMSLV
jgi:D-inositol-3-phosphate glycosyltransferase